MEAYDISEKVGYIDARTQGISDDVREIKDMLKVLPQYQERLSSVESDINFAKKVVAYGCSGLIGLIAWLFKGHG